MKNSARFRQILLAASLGLTAVVGLATTARAQSTSETGLQPGDVVQITVWQRPELSGDFTVAPDGSLTHPLYRQIRVTGIPTDQIEARVRSFLAQYEANPQIVVQPQYHVAISGGVMRPDIYAVPPGTTVAQVVTRAGGVVESGDREDVLLVRDGRETELDLTQLEAMQTTVESGDQILVKTERSGFGFRNTVLPIIHVAASIATLIRVTTR
jgi:polysaccharide export outer membrane protein